MKPVFLVTVFLCLLVTANVDAVALGATCNPADGTKADCTDNNAICPSTGTAKCQCKPGYTAYGTACAITHGTAGGACLTTGSACNGDTLVCESNFCTAIAQGKVNAACDTTRVCTGTNVICTEGFCTCREGFSGNKGDDDCTSNKGVALGQVSVWTLCMTILTMSLAVNVV